MSPKSMSSKPKKQAKAAKNKYLRPGTLAQLRYTRATAKYCKDIGKKRIVLQKESSRMNLFPTMSNVIDNTVILLPARPVGKSLSGPPITPKTPKAFLSNSESMLESLPIELLVKIMCHLHHDELRAVFHVSQRIRKAVLLAREIYFDYTTPDRCRQEILQTMTPQPKEHWPFLSKGDEKTTLNSVPCTPKAPRQGPRPPRLHLVDMKEVAAVLFQESAMPIRYNVRTSLPKPVCKSINSNRVLFYEDELCQAVTQNKLR